ncbi:MAG: hypothetical protein JWM32_2131 [Verrucomicrobia bacterium]|nr:hypothetical protein [Verrucomicrobiota bacterium]
MKTFPRQAWLLALGLSGVALVGFDAGCSLPQAQADLTRYFVLNTPPKSNAAPSETAHWRVALRAVEVPSFLRGKAMQARLGRNEVDYMEDSRWAENLEAGIGRVLRETLEGRGEISRVVTSTAEEHDLEIVVRVLRCEGDQEKGVARFTAAVEIYSTAPGRERRASEVFSTEVPGWDKQSYGQLAEKLSEAVDQLADRIAVLVGK